MEFTYDGGGMGKGAAVTLLVDGKKVGEGRPIGDDSKTGTSWHLPNCAVEYPLSLRISANGAQVLGRSEL
jgi:hypothetical protein